MLEIIKSYVFWYPVIMAVMWIMGGIFFYFRIEKKEPLPLTSTPMVSILIPCFNEERVIQNTIEHFMQLDYPNYEIIAINDGSSDNTSAILAELTNKYKKLRFINLKENCGKANALYLGLIASKGEILVSVDADSYLAPDALKYIVPHFTNKNNGERVGAVTGNPRVRNRSSLLSKIQLCEYSSIISMVKRTQRIWGKVMTVSGVVVAFRKRALMQVHLWDRDMITEDIAVTWKLEKNFWDIRYEPNAICWMLVPETLKGLFKQRLRWAQGGIEVILRNANIFKSWKERRLFPVYLEQIMTISWSVCWFGLTIYEIVIAAMGITSFLPYLWKSQFLSFICLLQFFVAIKLDSPYDEDMMNDYKWAAWYPVFYWYINAIVVIFAIPKTIFHNKHGLARWDSPDRGIFTAEAKESKIKVPDNDQKVKGKQTTNIIKVKQKKWKKLISIVITIMVWAYVLVYVLYIFYGIIAEAYKLYIPSFFIYDKGVVVKTQGLFLALFKISIIEILILFVWMQYNYIRFSQKNRRHFAAPVLSDELKDYFELDSSTIDIMQNQKIILLKKNIIKECLD